MARACNGQEYDTEAIHTGSQRQPVVLPGLRLRGAFGAVIRAAGQAGMLARGYNTAMKQDNQNNLEQIIAGYVPMEHLPYVIQQIRSYYLELISTELASTKTASRLRQKIVRS